jgi:CRP-like cAMP-binding protein
LQHQPALHPFTLNDNELDQLDSIIERKKPFQKGEELFKAGDELKSLYAIRSGTIKSYTITEQGDEQITAFHLAGDLVGLTPSTSRRTPPSPRRWKPPWCAKSRSTCSTISPARCPNCASRSCG